MIINFNCYCLSYFDLVIQLGFDNKWILCPKSVIINSVSKASIFAAKYLFTFFVLTPELFTNKTMVLYYIYERFRRLA